MPHNIRNNNLETDHDKIINDDNENVHDNSRYDSGIVAPINAEHVIHCLTIIGQIEGHYILPPQNKTTKYEHIIPALVAIEEDKSIEGLLIILNTVGGDVEAGLAIAELIAGMKKPTVSIVVGGGHSIGVPLAVSAKRSFIVPSATMTIHPVRMSGMVLGIPQTLSYFNKMQDRIVNFVTKNSKISEKDFRDYMMEKDELLMDVGSALDGTTAVKVGLIDQLGGLSDAISALYELIDEKKAEDDKKSEEKKDSEQDKNAKPKIVKNEREKVLKPANSRVSIKLQSVPIKHLALKSSVQDNKLSNKSDEHLIDAKKFMKKIDEFLTGEGQKESDNS